jgi:hypothetical protein
LHTKNEFPVLSGSALKVPGWMGGVGSYPLPRRSKLKDEQVIKKQQKWEEEEIKHLAIKLQVSTIHYPFIESIISLRFGAWAKNVYQHCKV